MLLLCIEGSLKKRKMEIVKEFESIYILYLVAKLKKKKANEV